MTTYTNGRNIIKCRYCAYFTARFRGHKKVGERKLRIHVLDQHEDEYKAALGLEEMDEDLQMSIMDIMVVFQFAATKLSNLD